MSGIGSVRNIPNYVKARTPEGVRRLFLQRQAMKKKQFIVLGNPVFDGENWFIWFTEDLSYIETLSGLNDPERSGE